MVQHFSKSAGLSTAWARMFFLYGPRENPRRLVPSVILSLLKGEPALSSHGEQIRDYMHVADVAEGCVELLDSGVQGACNIASGRAVTIRSIVEEIGLQMRHADLVRIGALPARANDAPLVVADVRHTTSSVGWKSRIPLNSGLSDTISWWRAQQSENGANKQ
jgi:nucleoside-diphosphate-sugar epimerase